MQDMSLHGERASLTQQQPESDANLAKSRAVQTQISEAPKSAGLPQRLTRKQKNYMEKTTYANRERQE